MEFIFSFALSVAASVIAYYICKWLDDQFRSGIATTEGLLAYFVIFMEIHFHLHLHYTRLRKKCQVLCGFL